MMEEAVTMEEEASRALTFVIRFCVCCFDCELSKKRVCSL
jgi:hypothetical protein